MISDYVAWAFGIALFAGPVAWGVWHNHRTGSRPPRNYFNEDSRGP